MIFASPRIEIFRIRNYSSKNVLVEAEFLEGTGGSVEFNYMWEQIVCDMEFMVKDSMAVVQSNIIPPNRYLNVIEYFPMNYLDGTNYERMVSLPFMDKLRGIFRRLDIICDDGKTIITLENLEEQILKKNVFGGGVSYTLEIFDYDLEIKP
jgi:hypothetical protein